jgi:SAM-dependent methyltransferase
MVEQEQVTQFYDRQVFPSRTSHLAYSRLVPPSLAGKTVGDFGCGQSLFRDAFRRLGCEAVYLDISWNAIRAVDDGRRVQASVTRLPLKEDSMDAIFCIGVVHHLPEMETGMRELVRVLRPDGRLYLGVYADRSPQAWLRRAYDAFDMALARRAIGAVTGLLIWIKNRKNRLEFGSLEHRMRIDDMLVTPLVRYLPADHYRGILEACDARVEDIQRISSMNILVVAKNRAS